MMESLHWNRSAGPSRGLAMDRSPDKGNSCRPCYDQHPSTGGTDDQRPLKEIGSITPTQCTCLSFLIKKDKNWKQIHCLIWPGQVSHNLRKTQPPFWCSYGKAMIHATTVYRIAFSFREGYLIPTDQHIVWWILYKPFVKVFLANMFACSGSTKTGRDIAHPQGALTNSYHGQNSFYVRYSPQRVSALPVVDILCNTPSKCLCTQILKDWSFTTTLSFTNSWKLILKGPFLTEMTLNPTNLPNNSCPPSAHLHLAETPGRLSSAWADASWQGGLKKAERWRVQLGQHAGQHQRTNKQSNNNKQWNTKQLTTKNK